MLSMRYLIVSLAAVFLALGIGIFIGFMIDGQEIFLNQQETLIDELEYKFGEIREDNEELLHTIDEKDKQIKYYEDFTNTTFPKLIEAKLEDTKVAIIETNNDYIYNDINSTILKAGGIVSSTTYIKKDFLLKDNEKFEEIFNYFVQEKHMVVNRDNFLNFLSEYIVVSIIENDVDTLHYLREKEIIELKGNYMDNIDCFIIAGGSTKEEFEKLVERTDLPIIRKIKQYNLPVVGVERSDVEYSYIDAYRKQKMSTIDNVDMIIGQYSLIEVLQGNYGNYGVKPSAERLIPQ